MFLLLALLVPVLCLALLVGADHLEQGLDERPADADSHSGLAS
jgi:hypothetical protein